MPFDEHKKASEIRRLFMMNWLNLVGPERHHWVDA